MKPQPLLLPPLFRKALAGVEPPFLLQSCVDTNPPRPFLAGFTSWSHPRLPLTRRSAYPTLSGFPASSRVAPAPAGGGWGAGRPRLRPCRPSGAGFPRQVHFPQRRATAHLVPQEPD